MKKSTLLVAGIAFCVAGCVAPAPQAPVRRADVRPVVVAHMDLGQKQRYLTEIKTSLRGMLGSAEDLVQRRKPQALALTLQRGDEFVATYVEPILNDAVAGENQETRFEVGKLYLLTAKFYLRTGAVEQSRGYLRRMAARYGSNTIFMNASIDRSDIGYTSLQEGFNEIRTELAK